MVVDNDAPTFSWDPDKSEACLADRGFDFGLASRVFEGRTIERIDHRRDYGEVRVQTIGYIEGRLFVVVYTQRGAVKHIISARRAHQEEFDKWLR